MRDGICLVAFLLCGAFPHGHGLVDQPHSFAEGESVQLKVNKLTSVKKQFPIDYDSLPLCRPGGGPGPDGQSLGQMLAGDRIRPSAYQLRMKVDSFCEQLCVSNLGRPEQRGHSPNMMVRAIRNHYHYNWIVDDMPSASKSEDDTTVTTRYWGGIPLGFISQDTGKAYVNNHVNIEIHYHIDEMDGDLHTKMRVVRFLVKPFSIKHDIEALAEGDYNGDSDYGRKIARINNPIDSCNPEKEPSRHTSYEMVTGAGREPQPASGNVLFTYDVIWVKNKNVHWADRWDIYLSMGGAIPIRIHWFSAFNSLFMLIFFCAIISAILFRNLRRDFDRCRRLAADEKAESIVEFPWKIVHSDVFRPPGFSPLLLSVCCGNGAQLLFTAFWTILFAALGDCNFLHPTRHGYLMVVLLVLSALHGLVAGYVGAVFYKALKGVNRQKATACTAFGFPGLAFGSWLIVNAIETQQGSTYALPVGTMLVVILLWICISTPLVYFGAHFGYKRDTVEFPTNTSPVTRKVPQQSWHGHIFFTLPTAGVLQLGVCYFQFYFVHSSVWRGYNYSTYGFLLLAFVVMASTSAGNAVLFNYFQLCGENHQWWWHSYITGGSVGPAVFIYSLRFVQEGEMSGFLPFFFYIMFMGLACLGLFLMTGFVGTSASLWFNKAIFASIITDDCGLPSSVSVPPPSSDQKSTPPSSDQNSMNGKRTSSTKKAFIAVFVLISLIAAFSPALFLPSSLREQSPSQTSHRLIVRGVEIIGQGPPAPKIHLTHTPHRFGIVDFMFSTLEEFHIAIIVLSAWAVIIALSVILKRRSARPGGNICRYNQKKVHSSMSARRRILCNILKDPVLLNDMNWRYGDLTSLLEVVKDWQLHGVNLKKDDCIKVGRWVIVPWIRNMNALLYLSIPITYCFVSDESLSMMILSMVFVHIIDNLLLYRTATAKGNPRIVEQEGMLAAVGIPVIEII